MRVEKLQNWGGFWQVLNCHNWRYLERFGVLLRLCSLLSQYILLCVCVCVCMYSYVPDYEHSHKISQSLIKKDVKKMDSKGRIIHKNNSNQSIQDSTNMAVESLKKEIKEAFAHYVYQFSDGQLLITDFRGVGNYQYGWYFFVSVVFVCV